MRLPTALVVQHTPGEAAARLADWLRGAGILIDTAVPYADGQLPGLDGYAALIVLGGPMGALDDAVAPWLPRTRELLRGAVTAGLPTLGICLGAQLLATALGGRVRRGANGPEIGPGLVAKRDASAGDRLFRAVPFTPDVVHWHWDEIATLPPDGTLIASSTRYTNQVFRVREHAWGLQFHVETTPEIVARWADEDADQLAGIGFDVRAALARWDLEALHADLAETWQPFALRFAELIREVDHVSRSA